MWQGMPDIMLAKCAESQALRAAFPNELSGIYSPEEMGQSTDVAPAYEAVNEDTGEVVSGSESVAEAFATQIRSCTNDAELRTVAAGISDAAKKKAISDQQKKALGAIYTQQRDALKKAPAPAPVEAEIVYDVDNAAKVAQ
jgi:hypothetical protein